MEELELSNQKKLKQNSEEKELWRDNPLNIWLFPLRPSTGGSLWALQEKAHILICSAT